MLLYDGIAQEAVAGVDWGSNSGPTGVSIVEETVQQGSVNQQVSRSHRGGAAAKDAKTTAAVGKPGASAMPVVPLQVYLTASPDDVGCRFWVGLAQKGKVSPRQLLDLPDVRTVFERAASGIEEQPPLMISDTSCDPVRYFFIMGAPEPTEPDRVAWVRDIVQAITSWAPDQVGFVLDPELLELPTARELLAQVLLQCARLPQTRQYFFSIEKHGFNAGLNAMIMLKRELEDGGIKVHVFH